MGEDMGRWDGWVGTVEAGRSEIRNPKGISRKRTQKTLRDLQLTRTTGALKVSME